LQRLLFAAGGTMVAVFAATMGAAIWRDSPLGPALGYFALGALGVAAAFWLIGSAWLRRAQPAQP
jgi:hypothetical protein